MKKFCVAACSGGPDSMALLDILRKSGKYDIHVAHVNYHKRPTADRDENIVKSYCDRYNIGLSVLSPHYPGDINFQSWAREVRYDFFVELAGKDGEIFIAHHKDDHIETYLFQRQRNMLCDHYGLRERMVYKGVPVVRPLLKYTKAELADYCIQNGIEYGIDESNLSNDYTRNKIRHSLIEKMTLEEKDKYVHEIEKANELLYLRRKKIKAFLDEWDQTVSSLISHPDALLILDTWLYETSHHHYSRHELKDLCRQLQSDCLIDMKDFYLESFDGKLIKEKKKEPVFVKLDNLEYITTPNFKLCQSGKTIESVDVKEIDFPIYIRNVKAGDKIEMRFGTKSLSRFFIDRKINRIDRKRWLVMENQAGKVIFVPGLGCDVEHFSVKANLFMIQ